MYKHNALGYWSGLALCLTKIRSSRARCPATALIHCKMSISGIMKEKDFFFLSNFLIILSHNNYNHTNMVCSRTL